MEATAPAKPTGFTATAAGNAQIDLAWTAPADDGGRAVSGYKIEVSDDGSTGSWVRPRRRHRQHGHRVFAYRAFRR